MQHPLPSLRSFIERFLRNETGATAIEYGLIMALVFLAIVGGVTALGNGVSDLLYNKIQSVL